MSVCIGVHVCVSACVRARAKVGYLEQNDLIVLVEVSEAIEALGELHDEVGDEHSHLSHHVQKALRRHVLLRLFLPLNVRLEPAHQSLTE